MDVPSRGPVAVELNPRPLRITVRRGRRTLVPGARLRVTDGTAHDQFVQLTAGVLAHEEVDDTPGLVGGRVVRAAADRVTVAVALAPSTTAP